jgi:DNA-binding response OmpR family regulator
MRLLLLADAGDAVVRRFATSVAKAGYEVEWVDRVNEVDRLLYAHGRAVVVWDPEVAGGDFLVRARRRHVGQTLVAWLPRASSESAAELIERGADEVLCAGMSERELAARLDLAVRRPGRRRPEIVSVGPLEIDPGAGEVTWRGQRIVLTGRERDVLLVLAEAGDRTVRREDLYREVWGYSMARGDRSVDVNVKRIRDKLGRAAGSEFAIRTEPGVGYRLELPYAPLAVTAL